MHSLEPAATLLKPHTFIFDNSAASPGGNLRLLSRPVEIVTADQPEQVVEAMTRLQQGVDDGLHAAGFLSYELGYALEPALAGLMPGKRRLPLLWFGLYKHMQTLGGSETTDFFSLHQQAEGGGSGLSNLRPGISRDTYLQRFERARELIGAGDIYQLNLTFPVPFSWQGNPLDIYSRLRAHQPVSYGACLDTGEATILSFSPELFFEIERGHIRTRPMKGTHKRGASAAEDRALRRALGLDEKNRAENLMIVDLMRNDFARICKVGSVRVSDLYRVETYPTLFQMTSGVSGQLRPDAGLADIFTALFPAGSITGAPKLRAMEIIRQLEDSPRGVYCGALGLISKDRHSGELSALFNVAIRTLALYPDGKGEAFVGSGVVADSQGAAEYDECLLKYRFMTLPGYQLIETMLLSPEKDYQLFEEHVARLAASAEKLGFLCPLQEIEAQLQLRAAELDEGYYRVRLLLSPSGAFEITSTRIDKPDPQELVPLVVSDQQMQSGDDLLLHKTTHRQTYDGEWARWNAEKGAGEVLFLNERGELTEGSRSNLFVEQGGVLLTPPLSSGLLPGTLRAQLLQQGRAREQVLTLADLEAADAIYVGNSVRGLQRGSLIAKA